MPADDPNGARPPVVLRIKLRYDDVDAMVQRFAPNVGKSGLFIPTKSLQPIGTEIKFELRLANDQPVLVGLGRVKAAKAPDPANPRAAFGLAIELMRVTREAREVIIRMIERRRAMGLADVAIPMPEDVESARRGDVETQPRADTGAIVSAAMARSDSEPILAAPPPKRTAKTPATGAKVVAPSALKTQPGIAGPKVSKGPRVEDTAVTDPPIRPTPPQASAQVLTAPRPTSGPVAVARSTRPSAAALAPEPARTKRPKLSDLIAKAAELSGAAGPAVVGSGLDDQVDVAAAMARARALAGGTDLDAELAALLDQAAAPIEISIEAASAELSRSLGGASVSKRNRIVADVPALGTAEVSTIPEVPTQTPGDPAIVVAAADAESGAVEAADQLVIESGPVVEARPAFIQASTVIGEAVPPPPPAIPETSRERRGTTPPPPPPPAADRERSTTVPPIDTAVVAALADEPLAERAPRERSATAPPAMPATIVEEDPELDSFERALDAARVQTGVTSMPPDVAPADPELDSFERALDAARIQTGVAITVAPENTADEPIDEIDPDDIEELPGESTQIGQIAGYDSRAGGAPIATQIHASEAHIDDADAVDRQLAEAESEDNELAASIRAAAAAYEAELAEVPEAQAQLQSEDDEEISDLDVLAEADANDADLLTSNGERESADAAPAYAPPAEYAQHEHPAQEQPYADQAEQPYAEHAAQDPYAAVEQPASSADPNSYAAAPDAYDPQSEPAYSPQEPAYAAPYTDQPYVPDPAYTTGPQQYAPPASYHTGPQQYTPPPSYPTHPTGPVNIPIEPTEGSGAKRRPFGGTLDPVTRIGSGDDLPPRSIAAPQRPAAKPVVRTPTRSVIKRRAATPEPVATSDDDFDFASQLDLGDDDDDDDDEGGPSGPPLPDPDAYNGPSEYTFAESLAYTPPAFAEPPGLDAALEFDDPHQFSTHTPAKPEPRTREPSRSRNPSRAPLAETARFAPEVPARSPHNDDPIDFDEPHGFAEPARPPLDDLESALSTLDVDLDHLEVPGARAHRAPRPTTEAPRLPGMPPERAPSDPPTMRPSDEARAVVQRELAQRAAASSDRPNRTPKRRGAPKRGTAAPPTPVKRPTPAPRAPSEDDGGVLIDFDDDDNK